MAEGYWNQQQQPQQQQQQQHHPPQPYLKRPRTEYELPPAMPSGHEMHTYLPHNDHGVSGSVKDTISIDSAYDRYLQSAKMSSLPSGEASSFGRNGSGPPGLHPMSDPIPRHPGFGGPNLIPNDLIMRDMPGRPPHEGLIPLPHDASNTLFVEGLPHDCTRREVAHIFRPFVGYREVRIVTKEAKHRSGDPLILCFVDFESPACAATALMALQGYQVDEGDPDTKILRLQFSRNPGPRSAPRSRGKR